MMPSDENLLNAFVKSHDEKAFRSLAGRYSGLIFHTAFRTLNDRMLAEDVSQRVLGVLAKKAEQVARGATPLPAWLHRTTVLEAKAARRAEFRHHRKKEALMIAPAEQSPQPGDAAWKDALPHLDAAIDSLPEADRHVILLHYVNDMTFPEIARQVGKSAAAVQKQSRRALDTLQRILGRRGVTLSLGVLTAGLTTEMAKAAPALLISSLGTIATVGQTTTATAIVVKKSTLAAIGVTVLLCGVPLARQQATISKLESQMNSASEPLPSTRASARPVITQNLSLLERLARDLKAQDRDVPRYLGAIDTIEERSDDELVALIKGAVTRSMPSAHQEILFEKLFDTLAIRNPELALNTLLEPEYLEHLARSEKARSQFAACLGILSERDGRKSLEWFRRHLDSVRSIQPKGSFPNGYFENQIRESLAYGLLSSDAEGAVEVLRSLSPRQIEGVIDRMAKRHDPFPDEKIPAYVRTSRALLTEEKSGEAVAKLITPQVPVGRGSMPYEAVDKLLASESFMPSEVDSISKRAGTSRIISHSDGLAAGIDQYKGWLETHLAEGVDRNLGETLGLLALQSGRPIYQEILDRQESEPSDDMIAGFLGIAGQKYDPHQIKRLTDLLADQNRAIELIRQIREETEQ